MKLHPYFQLPRVSQFLFSFGSMERWERGWERERGREESESEGERERGRVKERGEGDVAKLSTKCNNILSRKNEGIN